MGVGQQNLNEDSVARLRTELRGHRPMEDCINHRESLGHLARSRLRALARCYLVLDLR